MKNSIIVYVTVAGADTSEVSHGTVVVVDVVGFDPVASKTSVSSVADASTDVSTGVVLVVEFVQYIAP